MTSIIKQPSDEMGTPESVVDWENPPSLRDLEQNETDADIEHNNHQLKIDRWLDNLYIEGAAKPKKIEGRSSIAPKLIRKQAEWRYAALSTPFLSADGIFDVSPRTAGDRTRAQQNALVLNYQFNTQINKVDFINSFVRDVVDTGTVIVEVSWVSESEEITEEVPKYQFIATQDLQVAQQYAYLARLKQSNRDEYESHSTPGQDKAITFFMQTGELYIPQEIGTETVTRTIETKNHPMVEVCDAANIIIDPSCNGDLSKAQFIIKKFKSSLSELKKDGRYKNLDKIQTSDADPLADPDYTENQDIESFSFKDEPRKKLVVHNYWGNWDIHNTGITVPILVSWVGNTIIRMEKNPFPFKAPPFAIAKYMPLRRSVYGEPDGELLEENQQIIGATTRGIIDLMGRSANSQQGTKQGFLDATNKRKFKRGEHYEFNAQGDPQHAIYQHRFPEIPQSAYGLIAMQNADAESLTGIKAFTSGITGKSLGPNVGSGRDALDAASKRESDILFRLAQCITEVGRMFIAMNAEWLSEEETIRITNDQFITVRRDDLAGNYDLKLSISTPEEDNKKAEELAFMLQTTGNNMDIVLHNMILSDIARLRKMPGLAKRIEEYKPEPDPMKVQEAQLQIELLKAQIAKERALEAKHKSEAAANGYRGFKDGTQATLNEAKAKTETAKTRNIHSDSDQKDLNYLQQNSGIKHNQELQKENNKATNDMKKEIVKSQLNHV